MTKWLRARMVLPIDGSPIENGAVLVRGNRIAWVGPWARRPWFAGAATDLGDVALLPGLINAHCHLDYTILRGLIPKQATFADWIEKINALKRSMSEVDWKKSVQAGIDESVRFGTTTILNVAAYPHLKDSFPCPSPRIFWLEEMIDLREAQNPADRIDDDRIYPTPRKTGWGLSPHAPYTASPSLYVATDSLAKRFQFAVPVTTHVAESSEEREMFESASGPLFDLLQRLGRSMSDCGEGNLFYRLVRDGMLKAPWILAHANWVEDDVAPRCAEAGMSVVHCPRCHEYFQRNRFPLEVWQEAGVRVCVGTDSLASNYDLSLLAELRQFRKTHPGLPAEKLLRMVTRDAAIPGSRLGAITKGAPADLIAVPISGAEDAFEEVIGWKGAIPWTMVDGEMITGDLS
jgi:cytosine/adenosine deaminase-related metal-dependent hydrolase